MSPDASPTAPAIHKIDEPILRSIAAEIRAAFTYVTIAQLAYDMGQVERGSQACARAHMAYVAAESAGQALSSEAQEVTRGQLKLLNTALQLCDGPHAGLDPALRQPSLC